MKKNILFILGAGASADSGLPTYLGKNGLYKNNEKYVDILNIDNNLDNIWNFDPFYEKIINNTPGITYEKLKYLLEKYNESHFITQNIDGYIKSLNTENFIELHGNYNEMICDNKHINEYSTNHICKICNELCRPNILLYGEDLKQNKVEKIMKFVRSKPKYIVVIGSSLQIPYLRFFINKTKQRGSKVIHINPDPNYINSIGKNEKWIMKYSSDAIDDFLDDNFYDII